jgi:predicted  nucleic acid-binding Zn-ribbon protein
MKSLHKEESPLMQVDEESQEAIESYTEWKDIVTKNLPGIAEYRRLANEVDELEQNVNEMTAFLAQKNKELGDLESQYQSVQEDVQESRGLLEQTRQLAGSASRIAEKRMQVKQKQLDLSASAADYSGRDLKTVERELKEKIQAKDSNSTKVRYMF